MQSIVNSFCESCSSFSFRIIWHVRMLSAFKKYFELGILSECHSNHSQVIFHLI